MDVDPLRAATGDERRVALSLLRRAAESGKLTSTELDRRGAAVHRARLAGDIASALDGIDHYPFDAPSTQWPLLSVPSSDWQTPSQVRRHSTTTGYRPDEPLTVSGGLQSEKIGGRWIVPPYLRLQAGLSSIKLDCRSARAAASTVAVEVMAGLTTIIIVVPEGWGADATAVRKNLGTLRVQVPPQAASGCPALVFHGRLGITTLVTRGESRLDRWLDRVDRG